jgi:hypothetical protein
MHAKRAKDWIQEVFPIGKPWKQIYILEVIIGKNEYDFTNAPSIMTRTSNRNIVRLLSRIPNATTATASAFDLAQAFLNRADINLRLSQ